MTRTLFVDTFASPIGDVRIVSDGRALCALEFGENDARLLRHLRARYGEDVHVREVADPLGFTARARAYFAGELGALAEVPVDAGGTPFQRQVWAALREIPCGETTTYSAVAARIGAPRARRAVGLAVGRNPIAIAVPCHRVVGADGELTGYAGGLERKRWLLAHERSQLPLFAPRSGVGSGR
jgi:methylated-DNA-[protein]-cysteine S-methyltransferase